MGNLIEIKSSADIPKSHLNTPIGKLFEYHNLNCEFDNFDKAQLLIGTCMDHRIQIQTPKNFAYYIRTGGANMKFSGFNISHAITMGEVKHFALIGHNKCGMRNLKSKKDQIINGLCEISNWEKQKAENHFKESELVFEVFEEMEFTLNQVKSLRKEYPNIIIVPMMYILEDDKLYLINEKNNI